MSQTLLAANFEVSSLPTALSSDSEDRSTSGIDFRTSLPTTLKNVDPLWPWFGNRVRRLTSKAVLKTTSIEDLKREAAAAHFAARNTTIPIPRVYDIWVDSDGKGRMVVEFI